MKILTGIDVPFLPFGGSLIGCNDWYSNLNNNQRVRFLTLQPPDPVKWWTMDDVFFMDVSKTKNPKDFPKYVKKLTEIVERQIEEFNPDVIHCQHLNFGLSKAFSDLKRDDIPLIGICHGTDVQVATQNSFFLNNMVAVADKMDLLLFPSENMARDFFKLYKKPKTYKINSYGIPDSFYKNKKSSRKFKKSGVLRILYAGRLTSWKGADIAVESMRYTKPGIILDVVGNEDESGYRDRLIKIIVDSNLSNRITLIPQWSRNELLDSFKNYDAVVFPSRKIEAFSITTIEAQTAGTPVIYAKAGGIENAVEDSGIKLSRNTPRELGLVLNKIFENPDILEEYRKKGFINSEKFRLSKSKERLFSISQDCSKVANSG